MDFVTFDIEIAQEIPEGCKDYHVVAPLGITCAAKNMNGFGAVAYTPAVGADGNYRERMTREECVMMLEDLEFLKSEGFAIVTWNGLGFDFQVLAEECTLGLHGQERDEIWRRVGDLAWNSYDPGFQMVCEKGFMIGLQAAATGLGVQGKTEGMHGDLAPVMWKQGREKQDLVISYVKQDVVATANVWKALTGASFLPWTAKSGRRNVWNYRKMLPANMANAIPRPDTSWMSDPRPPESFYKWINL